MTKLKWNSVGERLFEAGVDRGVLYTKDVGTPPAPVAVGAPSATKPMLLPLRQWGVEQLLWLPGASGNYPSIPDTNLLPSNDAHLHQSKGGWFGNANAPTPVLSTDATPEIGSSHGKWTSTGDGNSSVSSQNNPATAGTTYSISARVRCGTGVARDIRIGFVWRTDASVFIGTILGSVVSVDDSEWVTVTATAVAPANTGNVRPIIDVVSQLTGEVFYFDKVCIRTGSDPTFVPSTRIVGDLDIRWFGSLPSNPSYALVSKYWWPAGGGSDSRAYYLFATGNQLQLTWSTDGVGASTKTLFNTLQPGKRWLRATLDVNNGTGGHTARGLTSEDGETWIQEGEVIDNTSPTSIFPSKARIEIGTRGFGADSLLKGAVLAFEIRDGIDGPIVASADFTNPAEVTGDSWTTPEGHTGTINRSGNATAELVDRNVWAFAQGLEYLDITLTELLNIGLSDFSAVVLLSTRSLSGGSHILTRHHASLSEHSVGINKSPTVPLAVFRDNNGVSYTLTGSSLSIVNVGWTTVGFTLDRDSQFTIFTQGVADGAVDISSIADQFLDNERNWLIGKRSDSSSSLYDGFIGGVVLFRRVLSSIEHAQLAAWDGSVANEPKWLRDDPDLVLYLNADADETVEAYEDNVVVSLHGLKPWYPDFHGIPWNGLVAVNERTVGGEVTPYYIDGIKYLDEVSNEDFEATIEAFTYPEEFMQYEGYKEVHNGLFVTHQQKRSFGLSYRTLVGNDLEGTDHAYKIHIIYNAMVAPSDRDNNTISDDIDPQNFSWDVVTKPPDFTGFKQTAHFVIDSREIPTQLLKDLEDILYGTETTDPRLPSATELLTMFETGSVEELYDIWDAGELGDSVDAIIDGGEL